MVARKRRNSLGNLPPALARFDVEQWSDFHSWRTARMDWARHPSNGDMPVNALRFVLETRREAASMGIDTLGTTWVDDLTGEVPDVL